MARHVIREMMRGGPKMNAAEGVPLSDEIEAAGGEGEGQRDAQELFANALEDLEQLAQFVPEVQVIAARLEALRPKVEAAEGEAVNAPELEPAGGFPEKLA